MKELLAQRPWDSISPKITVTLPEKQIPSSGQIPVRNTHSPEGTHALGNVSGQPCVKVHNLLHPTATEPQHKVMLYKGFFIRFWFGLYFFFKVVDVKSNANTTGQVIEVNSRNQK